MGEGNEGGRSQPQDGHHHHHGICGSVHKIAKTVRLKDNGVREVWGFQRRNEDRILTFKHRAMRSKESASMGWRDEGGLSQPQNGHHHQHSLCGSLV